MPSGWDSYAFFAISPRHLEAVITKTAQVLVEGSYSGILEPERHYIPVRRDFSNLDEALERLRDVEAVEAMADRAYEDVYLSGRNNLGVLAEQLLEETSPGRAKGAAVPFALARRPELPALPRIEGKPLRQLIPHIVTLAGALARQPEMRTLLQKGRASLPLKDVVREIIALRILARIRAEGSSGPEPWSLSVANDDGALVIRTEVSAENESELQLDGAFTSASWNHSAVAQFVPVYPRHPSWGWIALGLYGRLEFNALAELARSDPRAAQALLVRALER